MESITRKMNTEISKNCGDKIPTTLRAVVIDNKKAAVDVSVTDTEGAKKFVAKLNEIIGTVFKMHQTHLVRFSNRSVDLSLTGSNWKLDFTTSKLEPKPQGPIIFWKYWIRRSAYSWPRNYTGQGAWCILWRFYHS